MKVGFVNLHYMGRSYADMPLHYGQVPAWLYTRMSTLGVAITETIVMEYGRGAFLQRLSDPFWFQALGCVLGMDWHSSGITTSVMGALKRSVNERSADLGIYICGGKGKYSRETPSELMSIANKTGMDGDLLVRSSKLSAKVDNTAIQDGFQLYLHSFILSRDGDWAVVQQGMNGAAGTARRYHWCSTEFNSFVEEPHTFIYGPNQGQIINVTDKNAAGTRNGMLELVKESPDKLLTEVKRLIMPGHHDVRAEDIDLKRLGSVLAVAHEKENLDMESLLLLEGVGPRTLQSLVLVSEIIHGTPSRFTDPARFSFAHGGKDGHPFPVPTMVYDESIKVLESAITKAKLGNSEKNEAIKNLSKAAMRLEQDFIPNENFNKLIEKERDELWRYGGMTVMGPAKPPVANKRSKGNDNQLSLF